MLFECKGNRWRRLTCVRINGFKCLPCDAECIPSGSGREYEKHLYIGCRFLKIWGNGNGHSELEAFLADRWGRVNNRDDWTNGRQATSPAWKLFGHFCERTERPRLTTRAEHSIDTGIVVQWNKGLIGFPFISTNHFLWNVRGTQTNKFWRKYFVFRAAWLRVKRENGQFAQESVRFPGHTVSAWGDWVEGARDFATPSSLTEVRAFIGIASHRRTSLHPCTTWLKVVAQNSTGHRWRTGRLMSSKRSVYCTAPLLSLLDFSVSFTIYTDASDAGTWERLVPTKRFGYRMDSEPLTVIFAR